MVRKPKKKPRDLTPEEKRAAARIALLVNRCEQDRQGIADELGVTVGALNHWVGGVYAVPVKRVAALAKILGAEPAEISPAWQEAFGANPRNHTAEFGADHTASENQVLQKNVNPPLRPVHKGLTSESGNLRPDPVILSLADYWVGLQEAVEGRLYGLPWWERIANMYARIAASGGRLTAREERELLAESRAKVLEQQGAAQNVGYVEPPAAGGGDK